MDWCKIAKALIERAGVDPGGSHTACSGVCRTDRLSLGVYYCQRSTERVKSKGKR